MPLYMMSFHKIPKWVIDQIDKMRRSFLWKGSRDISPCVCLVRWEEVCRLKDEGGLGIANLKQMNQALLGKWLWRYFNQSDLMWRKLIQHMYYRDTSIFQHKKQ